MTIIVLLFMINDYFIYFFSSPILGKDQGEINE